MKKIIITEQQTRTIINELFSDKLQQNLIQKFKSENPNLEEHIIKFYIDRFDQLRNTNKIQQKDITKYTWKELETVIDINQPKLYDKSIKISDSDLIYNQNGLKIYLANSQKACVTYGNGYSFCISARGEGNMYGTYRFEENYTIYFVMDETKTKEIERNRKFIDPTHLLVIMVREPDIRSWTDSLDNYNDINMPEYEYQITTANNDGEIPYTDWKSIVSDYPRLKELKKVFIPHDSNPIEEQLYDLTKKYNLYIRDLNDYQRIHEPFPPMEEHNIMIPNIEHFNFVNDIINKNVFYEYTGFSKITKKQILKQTRPYYIEPQEWVDKMNKEMFAAGYNEEDESDVYILGNAEVKKRIPSEQYLKYLKKVREIMYKYFHEKNKLNYQQQLY